MKRVPMWIIVCVALWCGSAAEGQQPAPRPGVYPYPGMYYPSAPMPPGQPYVVPPYGPMAPPAPMPPGGPYGVPTGPYGVPMGPSGPAAPMGPYGVPMGPTPPYAVPGPIPGGPVATQPSIPIPPDPRLPMGPRPSAPPVRIDGAPKPGAGEPYLVQPDGPKAPKTPEPKTGNVITEPIQRFVELVTGSSDEPYTTYEGARYPAEERLDNTRMWVQANYIHWWIRGDRTPPLVTTGDANNPTVGTLGNADTVVLLGGNIEPRELNGIQATIGMWLDQEKLQSLEIGGFWLGRAGMRYGFRSDANGFPIFGQPLIQGGTEGAFLFSLPGAFSGTLLANTQIDFHGLELNVYRNILRVNGCSLDSLWGARYLYMADSLTMAQQIEVLPGGAGFAFAGNPLPAGSTVLINDSFAMSNRFYGGTIGLRFNWTHCSGFDFGITGKVSMGATSHAAVIAGSSIVRDGNGVLNAANGGTLAQGTNIGRHTSTDFSVVPEVNLTAGYQLTSCLRILVGYTALDWNRIQRVGNQIDRNIDFRQVPTAAAFVPGNPTDVPPFFPAVRTNFWAQGINVGLELKF